MLTAKTNSPQSQATHAALNTKMKTTGVNISPTPSSEEADRTIQSAKASKTPCCFKSKHHRTKNL